MAVKAEKAKKTADKAGEQTSERRKALDMALAQIEKQFGKGSVMRLGENSKMNVDAIPTGSMALDAALGIGEQHDRVSRFDSEEIARFLRDHDLSFCADGDRPCVFILRFLHTKSSQVQKV